jgi:hypothetical protein
MARDHWAKWRPAELAAMTDPESFFSTLGIHIADSIDALADQIAGPDPAGETYLEKVQRLRMARRDAESDLLRDALEQPEASEDGEESDLEPDPGPLVTLEELEAWQRETEAEIDAEESRPQNRD